MACKIDHSHIIDFQFNRLNLADRSDVEKHLVECSFCLQEYFLLRRDIDSANGDSQRPSQVARTRLEKEFARYGRSILGERQQLWLASNRRTILLGGLVAAAAVLVLVFSSQLRFLPDHGSDGQTPSQPSAASQDLDTAVDSGGSSPGHINIL